VTGAFFIALSVVPTIPVAGMALILGIDCFMSEARALVKVIGNGVATVVISRPEGELDFARVNAVFDGRMPVAETVAARVDLVDSDPVATFVGTSRETLWIHSSTTRSRRIKGDDRIPTNLGPLLLEKRPTLAIQIKTMKLKDADG
jgi:hypothetical protein